MKTRKYKIGVVDTTFARVNMGEIALKELRKIYPSAEYIRVTVPGIKDLPGAAKRLLDLGDCDAVMTLGWVGKKEIDKYSYLAMSMGLINAQLLTNKILIDVTIHEDEADSEKKLLEITVDRIKKHCMNLIDLLTNPDELIRNAGKGKRQGYPDAGSINPKPH